MRHVAMFLGTLILLLAAGCGGTVAPPDSLDPTASPDDGVVSSDDPTPLPSPLPSGEVIIGEAVVDSVEFLTLESFPVQINAIVRGNLPDGCTAIGEITQSRADNAFVIHIATTRPKDQFCTEALVPYEQNVALDVYGLPKGVYTVDINAYQATFELQSDNILLDAPPVLDATATPESSIVTPPPPQGESGITGIATVGPMCPVMQVNSPCPDQPIQAPVDVLNAGGGLITTFTTDAGGGFTVALPAGTYILRPRSPSGLSMPYAPEQTVIVVAGQFTQVLIQYDSGIR